MTPETQENILLTTLDAALQSTCRDIPLSKIDSPEAKNALEEVCRDSSGKIYTACKRILEGSKVK
ncbi:MAG: hypothetical protein WA162_01460 [Thermodesulfobacteriota bacterium]